MWDLEEIGKIEGVGMRNPAMGPEAKQQKEGYDDE